MKKKIIIILLIILITFSSHFIWNKTQNKKDYNCGFGTEYCNAYQNLIPHFITYDVFINKKQPNLIRLGLPIGGVYIFPKFLLNESEALMSYGIYTDDKFEKDFAELSQKPAYGFDCGSDPNIIKNTNLFTFEPECIGTDEFVLKCQTSTQLIHTFSNKIKELGLENKKIYLKMDIAGAEFEPGIFDDILLHAKNITGISLVIHMDKITQIQPAINLLNKIEKDFILIVRQTHFFHNQRIRPKNTKGLFDKAISLTYINKNLIDDYNIKLNQNTKNLEWEGSKKYIIDSDILMYKYIPFLIKNTLLSKIQKEKEKYHE